MLLLKIPKDLQETNIKKNTVDNIREEIQIPKKVEIYKEIMQ